MNIMQHRMTGRMRMSGVAVGLLVAVLAACAGAVKDHAGNTSVYIVRHAEVNRDDPDRPLIEKGRARAQALVQHLQGVSITHLLTSHTDRTRDTLVPLAKARGLEIKQFPKPGSEVDGKVVDNRTPGKAAIKPLIAAIRTLPPGSTAVVAGNGGNLYGIMAGLGVSVDSSCTPESRDCIPCAERECFPVKQFNNIWKVTLTRDGRATMQRSTYGD